MWMEELDEDLFGVIKVKVKKTRKEKRAEKQRREQLQAEVNEARQLEVEEEVKDGYKHELDISSKELRVLQATDPTLGSVRIAVKMHSGDRVGFFSRNGLRGFRLLTEEMRWWWSSWYFQKVVGIP